MKSVRILVVTSTRGFGQLIQQTLEESRRYNVTLVENVLDALISIKSSYFNLSILDPMVKGGSLVDLAKNLRFVQPDIKLIIIPPDNDLTNPIITAIAPDGYLSKPFYLPDLFDTIEEVLGYDQLALESYPRSTGEGYNNEKDEDPGEEPPSLDWMEDSDLAELHLTRLSLETAAQAALIVRKDQLWVFTGQISEQAAQELTSIVNNFWQKKGDDTGVSGDKIRFTRLETSAVEYLLYVTPLGDGMVLALAFDTETPFSKIRAQAVNLARSLAAPLDHNDKLSWNGIRVEESKDKSNNPILPFSEDRPIHRGTPTADTNMGHETHTSETNFIWRTEQRNHPQNTLPHTNSSYDNSPESRDQTSSKNFSKRPIGALQMDDLRPLSPAMHSLSFACLLIPRIPVHHLVGELASSLAQWLGQLCLAYGWRLEHLSIRPGYLLWIALVSPSTSPSFHIRIIRKQTSQRLFTSFPYLNKDNPSGDFWAPGYLILSSNQPPAANIINQYIDHTRLHQGA
jgi:DNA-binding response OmpR family regulator/REP element-mobilizing transposase RayT